MRSLIILEVEHGEDTDALNLAALDAISAVENSGVKFVDYIVRVDVPECF